MAKGSYRRGTFKAKARELFEEIGQEVKGELLASGEAVADRARALVATDTGKLKTSISVKLVGKGRLVRVSASALNEEPGRRKKRTVNYARLLEFGRNKRPFLYPALRQEIPAFRKRMADAIRRALKNKIGK